MFNKFKKQLSPKENIKRIEDKFLSTTNLFEDKLNNLENFANTIHQKSTTYERQIQRFKQFFHSIDTLISDKDKDLKLIFANESMCVKVYGLDKHCTDLISGRFEYEVMNDYIERTKLWNTFVESLNFNIDEIVKEQMKEQQFIQIGFLGNDRTILKTTIKPYFEENEFNGLMTISKIINFNEVERCLAKGGKLLHKKNNYTVYEI